MKTISDVIKELDELREEVGNVEVIGVNNEEISFTIDRDNDTVVIVAE